MRRGHDRRRILLQRLLEIWVIERRPEMGDGLPYGVVHQKGAPGDPLMELRGNVTRFLFHPGRVLCPGFQERRNVCLGHLKYVHENNRRLVGLKLLKNRYFGIQRSKLKHVEPPWGIGNLPLRHYDVITAP